MGCFRGVQDTNPVLKASVAPIVTLVFCSYQNIFKDVICKKHIYRKLYVHIEGRKSYAEFSDLEHVKDIGCINEPRLALIQSSFLDAVFP
ncbi:hypothetical protein FKM82_009099 [Ascaphus truei]